MAVIEQRYAQALADLVAKGAMPAEALRRELADVAAEIAASHPLQVVLSSPAVRWEQKLAVVDAIARKSRLSPLARNFLAVVAQRGRMGHLVGMEQAFEQLLLDQRGVVKADVASARTLSAGEHTAIERELARRLGRTLEARFRTDPELVGGFVARVGDQVFDGSIRGRLHRLRQQLLSA